MDPRETAALIGLAQRRFQNFSEAADSLLGTLTAVVPGVLVLGRLDRDEQIHYVIEVRGDGIGGLLEARRWFRRGRRQPRLDADHRSRRLDHRTPGDDGRPHRGDPLRRPTQPNTYLPEHAAELGIAARLLGHEWESVQLRSELRRLRGQVNAGPSTDHDTGLPDRDGFMDLLGAEWKAVEEEETVESVLVVCRVAGTAGDNEAPVAGDRLALKLAADVLAGTVRGSDKTGRIGEMALGAILVNCKVDDTPGFVARYLAALERVGNGTRPPLEVTCGVQPLALTSTPAEALSLAEEDFDRLRPGLTGGPGVTELLSSSARRSIAGFDIGAAGVTPPSNPDRRGVFLDDVVVKLGLADREAMDAAVQSAQQAEKTFERYVLESGVLDEEQLSRAVAERNGLDHIDLDQFPVDTGAAEMVTRSAAERYRAVPVAFAADGAVIVAVD